MYKVLCTWPVPEQNLNFWQASGDEAECAFVVDVWLSESDAITVPPKRESPGYKESRCKSTVLYWVQVSDNEMRTHKSVSIKVIDIINCKRIFVCAFPDLNTDPFDSSQAPCALDIFTSCCAAHTVYIVYRAFGIFMFSIHYNNYLINFRLRIYSYSTDWIMYGHSILQLPHDTRWRLLAAANIPNAPYWKYSVLHHSSQVLRSRELSLQRNRDARVKENVVCIIWLTGGAAANKDLLGRLAVRPTRTIARRASILTLLLYCRLGFNKCISIKCHCAPYYGIKE